MTRSARPAILPTSRHGISRRSRRRSRKASSSPRDRIGHVHVTAIIAAGGRGARLGGVRPKQFLTLGGRPILQRSVDAFLSSDRVTDLVVALPADLAAVPPDYLRAQSKPIEIVEGGARRQDSVASAFAR